jgi:uncharacterized protein (DUF1697 family)
MGYLHVQTYIASGNVVLQSQQSSDLIEAELQEMIAKEFQCNISVLVRTEKAWTQLVESHPFETLEPHRLKSIHFGLTKTPLQMSALTLEQCLGAPVTLRNLNTVAKTSELLRALPDAG